MTEITPLAAELTRVLRRWSAPNEDLDQLRRKFHRRSAESPPPLYRNIHPEYFTASCFVLNQNRTQIALTLHRKAGLWLQFGGHLESGDTSPAAAALREAREESGLVNLQLAIDTPVDLHQHDLSSAFGSCRTHLDLAYVAIAEGSEELRSSPESLAVSWWPLTALPHPLSADLPGRIAPVVDFAGAI